MSEMIKITGATSSLPLPLISGFFIYPNGRAPRNIVLGITLTESLALKLISGGFDLP